MIQNTVDFEAVALNGAGAGPEEIRCKGPMDPVCCFRTTVQASFNPLLPGHSVHLQTQRQPLPPFRRGSVVYPRCKVCPDID